MSEEPEGHWAEAKVILDTRPEESEGTGAVDGAVATGLEEPEGSLGCS